MNDMRATMVSSRSSGRTIAGYAMVAGSASAWGLWPLFLRRAEAHGPISPELEAAVALGLLTVLSGVAMIRDRVRAKRTLVAWLGVAWLGLSDALNCVLYFKAIQTTSVAIAVVTHYLTPVLVALGAPLVLGERVTKRTFAAVGIALTGLVLLVEPFRERAGGFGAPLLGGACGVGSAFFYASNVLTNKRLSLRFSGSELSFWHGIVAVPLIAMLVPFAAWESLDTTQWTWLGSGAVGSGAVAGLVFVWGLRRIPAAHASALTLLEPFVAVLVAVAFFREVPTAVGLVGGVLVLVGAALVIERSRTPT